MKLIDSTYIVFDLETTGLSPKDNQIIEIAAEKISFDGTVLGTFHKFITLTIMEKLPEIIINLTGITDSILIEEGCDIGEVMEEFEEFIEGSILVAQNARFDMSFLIKFYVSNFNKPFPRHNIDTIMLGKLLAPGKDTYKLSALTGYFQVEYDSTQHHRADYDVFITKEVFIKQLTMLTDVHTISELNSILGIKPASEKQISYLDSLMGKRNMYLNEMDNFTITNASVHIDLLK